MSARREHFSSLRCKNAFSLEIHNYPPPSPPNPCSLPSFNLSHDSDLLSSLPRALILSGTPVFYIYQSLLSSSVPLENMILPSSILEASVKTTSQALSLIHRSITRPKGRKTDWGGGIKSHVLLARVEVQMEKMREINVYVE